MISYEDLCQALDRFNARRRNEAELAELDGGAVHSAASVAPSRASVDDQFAATGSGHDEYQLDDFDELPDEPPAGLDGATQVTSMGDIAADIADAHVVSDLPAHPDPTAPGGYPRDPNDDPARGR